MKQKMFHKLIKQKFDNYILTSSTWWFDCNK